MVPDDIQKFVNSCFRAHGSKHRKYFSEFCRLAVGSWSIWIHCGDYDFDDLVIMQQDIIWELYNRNISRRAALDLGFASIMYAAFDEANIKYSRSS